ncbi:hypothetical protein D9756_002666 [Leucocoprinus leucothites]|uniref:Phosphatidate phosphatase APP1 catalytic domain-containing protein n=1 Tax=Leucocoprinus leucothites TaxID=201217 RepID=A0A8H5GCW7_9AGAR|nr:hypothetical protein D9756_002666 [Leucoagaricus leucothites]
MSTVDMTPSSSSWRHMASTSSRLSSLKGLINHSVSSTNVVGSLSRAANAVGATEERRQSWRTWATQKIRGKNQPGSSANEVLTLFPGWAARRYAVNEGLAADNSGQPVPFKIDVFVSGYAVSRRSKEQATRSQRAFLRLAKSFAALPRIIDHQLPPDSTPTGESLSQVNIPQVSEEFRVLDQQFQALGYDDSGSENESESDTSPTTSQQSSFSSPTLPPKQLDTPSDVLQKLHYNLESRLQLFWSSTLPSRTVRLHLFASPRNPSTNHPTNDPDAFENQPLASQDVETGVDGSFNAKLCIDWEDLCQHPGGVHIAYCEMFEEHDLVVVAELLPPPPNSLRETSSTSTPTLASSPQVVPSTFPAPPSQPQASTSHLHAHSHSHSHHHHHPHLHNIVTAIPNLTSSHPFPSLPSLSRLLTPTRTRTRTTIPITNSPIRVISDIDDTVKHSGVTEGARIVFHNVFAKELKDGVIPGMGDWYTSMWQKGVRFHYVSNGPYEYLSLLHEFFEISKLPPGSIKLKSYAGRSLFSGLLSTPAARKRAGVVDILNSLPSSRFILIGDSGEQDLELYADLAKERPEQILAVFIRDSEEALYEPIDDPTGWNGIGANTPYQTGSAGNTDVLATASSPILTASRGEPVLSRPGKAKRAFSDTFASMRASVSGRSPDGLLREEPSGDESIDTPKPQHLPTFTFSPQTPHAAISSSPSTASSLSSASSTSLTSSPVTLTPASGYITTPPAPVSPPSVPTSVPASYSNSATGSRRSETNSFSSSQPNRPHPQRHASLSSRSKLIKLAPPSHADTLPPASPAVYYKPESSPRYIPPPGPSSNNGRHGSLGFGSGGMSGGYIAEGASSGSSSSSLVGGGRLSESVSERKRNDLQMRVNRARTQMPSSIRLRVFRDPSECAKDVDLLLPRA